MNTKKYFITLLITFSSLGLIQSFHYFSIGDALQKSILKGFGFTAICLCFVFIFDKVCKKAWNNRHIYH